MKNDIQFCIPDISILVVTQNINDLNNLNLGNKEFSIFAMNICSIKYLLQWLILILLFYMKLGF